MQRGDLLLTPGWHFHGHQNVADSPMAWLDGLDIPFVQQTDSGFFAYGSNTLTDTSTPDRSRAEPVGPSWPAARSTPERTTKLAARGVPLATHGSGSCRAVGDRTRGAAG